MSEKNCQTYSVFFNITYKRTGRGIVSNFFRFLEHHVQKNREKNCKKLLLIPEATNTQKQGEELYWTPTSLRNTKYKGTVREIVSNFFRFLKRIYLFPSYYNFLRGTLLRIFLHLSLLPLSLDFVSLSTLILFEKSGQ